MEPDFQPRKPSVPPFAPRMVQVAKKNFIPEYPGISRNLSDYPERGDFRSTYACLQSPYRRKPPDFSP